MGDGSADLLQGTLDLLILKSLSLGPMHGLGVSRRIEQITGGTFRVRAGSLFPALHRLENLGCSRALIAQSVNFVLVQRLVRKLCSACRKVDPPTPALLESLVARQIVDKGTQVLPHPVGCDACVRVCSALAIRSEVDRQQIVVNPNLCVGCGACTTVCPTGALT